jgi:hypothetical protein
MQQRLHYADINDVFYSYVFVRENEKNEDDKKSEKNE